MKFLYLLSEQLSWPQVHLPSPPSSFPLPPPPIYFQLQYLSHHVLIYTYTSSHNQTCFISSWNNGTGNYFMFIGTVFIYFVIRAHF